MITAANSAVPGGSSIALVLESVVVSLDHVDLTARNASNGTNGVDGVAGEPGSPGQHSFSGVAPYNYAAGGLSSCGSTGGRGGYEAVNGSTFDAVSGLPAHQNNGGDSSQSAFDPCSDGGAGVNAAPGSDGQDGSFSSGLLVDSHGAYGVNGTDGTTNGPGGGGGGGGARFGSAASYASGTYPGGGGGGGGCAATPGTAGTAGGSSIALLSIGSFPSFSSVVLTAGQGGNGGQGGAGKSGGMGGYGGWGYIDANGLAACDGGPGGAGSNGGRGGNGTGGYSALVVYVDNMVDLAGATLSHPAPSQAGVGPGGADDGVAADQVDAVRKQ